MPQENRHRQLVRLFEADPDLLRRTDPRHADFARRELAVDAIALGRGGWQPGSVLAETAESAFALLLLDGFITRSVELRGRVGVELLGPGDVLTPWAPNDLNELIDTAERWRVLEPARIAILDEHFEAWALRLRGVMCELLARQDRRARSIAVQRAMMQVPGLGNRLSLLLWSIGEHWGRMRPDGLAVTIPLSHATLAELIGARRPSVTVALKGLADLGLVRRLNSAGWLLLGPPPAPPLVAGEADVDPLDPPLAAVSARKAWSAVAT